MIAQSQIKEDLGITDRDVEERWKEFLTSMLAETVQLCKWLCGDGYRRCADGFPRTLGRRLLSAATGWQWVFDSPECELPLEEACLFLGISPDLVRSRILAACRPPEDINQVVARILLECSPDAKRESKDQGSPGVGAPHWARLRDFRSEHPTGSSFEDFCRFEVGGGEDGHAG